MYLAVQCVVYTYSCECNSFNVIFFVAHSDSSVSSGSQTIDRKKVNKVKGEAKPRRFTIHSRTRKKSRQVTLPTIGGAAEDESHTSSAYPDVNRSSLATSLNWSVPNDLPTVTQQSSADISSGPTSLENLSITLEPDSNLDRGRCASNPDIVNERRSKVKPRPRLPADFYSVSDIQRGPGSAGPLTCDVSVQVDSKHVFTFPTPPNSVSPTLPIELSQLSSPQHHHALLYSQKYVAISTKESSKDDHGQFSSSNSLDNRHSSGSFPFVPEEDEENITEDLVDYNPSSKKTASNGRIKLLSTTDTIEEEV